MDIDSTNGASKVTFVESLAKRVRARARSAGLDQAKVGKILGLPSSTVGNYWAGKRVWPTETLGPLATALNTNVGWLIGHETRLQQIASGAIAPSFDHAAALEEELDLVQVQEIDLAYGLGGQFSDGPVEVRTHHFPREWVQSITATPASMLTIARGRGDSMQPTIQDGDMVIIDRSQRTIREQDAMWALTIGDFAMIKRVRSRGERIQILSDNTLVPMDEAHHEEINVVGRVIFVGRRV